MQRVDDERVLHIDEHAHGRVHARQGFDGQHGMEEPGAPTAELLRHLDAHHAEAEQLLDQRGRNLRALVHLAAERANLAIGEFIHAVTKEAFVFGQARQGRLGHAGDVSKERPFADGEGLR